MSAQNYLITGRKGTGVHDRLEIEDLQSKQPQQFTLFILAFLALQGRGDAYEGINIPPAARFPEIAGIHGLPFSQWSGDPAKKKSDFDPEDPKDSQPVPSRFGGYCNHGSVVFPTWHRPYVMAIEQAIGDIAVELAKRISANNANEATQWHDAAQALRFPFWDWAAEKVATNGVPRVLTDVKVDITMPGGTTKSVDNPLSYYKFKTIPAGFEDESTGTVAYFQQWQRTFRYAASTPTPTESGDKQLNATIKQDAKAIRQNVGRLFTFDDDGVPALVWDEFSNHTTQSLRPTEYYNIKSLESIHDTMHNLIGGNGHMSDPDYAGFDPIFYLHHCNVDRLLALWEYVYPQYYMGDGYPDQGGIAPFTQSRGTYDLVYNAKLIGSTGLAPFRMENSQYWTSDKTRFLADKYYSYPEVAGVKVGREINDQQRIQARKSLQKFYGVLEAMPTLASPKSGVHGIKLPLFTPSAESVPKNHTAVPDYRNFVVIVQANEFAFNGPYSIDVYFDAVANSHGKSQAKDHIFIGTVAVFARPDHSDCKGCSTRRDAGSIVRGVVPIPLEIVNKVIETDNIDREGASEDVVAAALKSHLHGIIVDRFGQKVGGAVGNPTEEDDALKKATAPDLTLVSSAAAFSDGEQGAGTLKWFDWKNHGRVFDGGHRAWKAL
ncbi:di-copper centre-containing protein [Phanerochaete sordida]|uniref:tyrosinase n=1 Tax=Phanerochaete sordida TaxID=48140 RepID=A0A9P3G6B3_9APHY|nr:di-copper centre-containing protein [Phanerochaete sordida]